MVVMDLILYGIAGLVGLIILVLFGRRISNIYHRVPPSQVMVIYGRGKTIFGKEGEVERVGVRLVTGGGAVPIVDCPDEA